MLPIQIHCAGFAPWFSKLAAADSDLGRLFDHFLAQQGRADEQVAAYPVDIREDDTQLHVEAELPGFDKGAVNVTMEKGVLTIDATREVDDVEGKQHLHERRYTRVFRRFTLPDLYDESSVEATLDKGVLHVTIKKRPEAKSRKIDVK